MTPDWAIVGLHVKVPVEGFTEQPAGPETRAYPKLAPSTSVAMAGMVKETPGLMVRFDTEGKIGASFTGLTVR